MTGLDRASLDDDRWLEAIDPADRSAATSLWSRARATLEPCSGEYRFLADGAPGGFAELNLYPEVEARHGARLRRAADRCHRPAPRPRMRSRSARRATGW